MKFEIVCRDCGNINRNEIPVCSKNDGLELSCESCESVLITFYHDEHPMAIAISSQAEKTSKVVKTD